MKTIAVLIAFLVSGAVQASTVIDTQITRLMNNRNFPNYTFVQTAEEPARGTGHCHTNARWSFILNTDDAFGKQMHAQLLAAFAAGKTVRLDGTNSCPTANTEELIRIEVY